MEKLPKNTKQVFKGTIFDVYHWDQKMFDGTVETFEVLKRPDTALVIAIVDDKILLLNQRQPHRKESLISLPGGRIEKGEAPLIGAKRELLEETGYASSDWTLWKKQSPLFKIVWNIYTYIAKDCKKIGEQNLDAGEKIETKLMTFDEFLMLSEDPNFYEKELGALLVRARFDKKFREDFKRLLFN